ncbi:pantoate--beta-alanine ligase [Venenivibrio stagnispumantis]|uniref:Pantothenate synthetase n=1 Tax=Venenivibrio stagnispumantis TaxID=407998 RepID=A0AA45WKC7_9AQUI|nr:pantoate--beta-alanine ligase [Venenivibrio stagnispumantis]MCW4573480.1 pantoate--beta-alanine ligase [Venenivibrio stagnispumantis]SMP06758.1 pantoate--beta-alanine ligase [Venenivibrio stagnispumantis]
MKVITDIKQMKDTIKSLKKEGKSVGFVPTMGYLHQGHLSLLECSKKENDITVLSIFVNPLQFGKNEDLDRYPRDFERDKNMAKDADIIFYPDYKDMYPQDFQTYVEVVELTKGLCGAYRPGHFRGVTTVVMKLFNIVNPDRAYFGKKDYQQYIVIKQMVKDLNMDIEIIGCPIVREEDGLAMSSRNKYLSEEERKQATGISKALFKAKEEFEKGERNPEKLKEIAKNVLYSYPLINLQYLEIVDGETLKQKQIVEKGDIMAIAVYVGNTRLIDNVEF